MSSAPDTAGPVSSSEREATGSAPERRKAAQDEANITVNVNDLGFDSEREEAIYNAFNEAFDGAGLSNMTVVALADLCVEQQNNRNFMQDKTAEELYATIRALHPWLPCYITIGKRFLSVNPYKCSCISLHESYSPGEIIAKDKKTKSLTIVCKCGNALKMEDLKLWGFWIRPFTKLFINNIKLNTTMD